MPAEHTSAVSRRSSRVPVAVPLLVTSLDPHNDFSEVCETLVVSAHGCSLRSPMRVQSGVPVHLHTKQGREMMARIVDCQPIGSNPQNWRLGAQLDEPNNFWDLNPCPEDWLRAREPKPAPSLPQATIMQANPPASPDQLRETVGQLLQPFQAELAGLREKLEQRENHRNRFEVSLSHIPPELEQELWTRLRQDLGQRALQLAREESERILVASHVAIDRKITQTQRELQQHASEQLKNAEQSVQALADGITETVDQHFRDAIEDLQQNLAQAEGRLNRQEEELAQALQQRLEEEHAARRQDLEQMQEKVAAEWSHMQTQLAALDARLTKLDEAARRLESDFAARLSGLASEVVSATKAELEGAAATVLTQLSARGARQVSHQLDEACDRLKQVQNEIETSISEALQARLARGEQAFEQTINDLAQQCVERWRMALAGRLNSFAGTLAEQLHVDVPSTKRTRES